MGCSLWREDGSVVYNCCWLSPAQSFSGPSPTFLLSQIWDFPFCCLLRLAGSRWRYSTPPPHGSWIVLLCTAPYIVYRVSMEIVGCFSVSVVTSVESLLTWNLLTETLPSNGLFRVYTLQRERELGEPLANNGLPFWFHYSGFQAVLTEPLLRNGHIRHNINLYPQ
jgi:hypothetical protein